jgi:hypothetical protein
MDGLGAIQRYSQIYVPRFEQITPVLCEQCTISLDCVGQFSERTNFVLKKMKCGFKKINSGYERLAQMPTNLQFRPQQAGVYERIAGRLEYLFGNYVFGATIRQITIGTINITKRGSLNN